VNRARRCLLVEGLSYHWEVLPPWVGMLQQLGYDVEVAAAGSSSGHRETLTLLQSRCRTHQAAEVQDLPLDDFDFVVLNSLVHEGYFFHEPPKQRPNLKWIQDLGLPSISVVHEPVHWVEKRITHSFHEVGGHGRRVLNLLTDGCFQYEMGFWSRERWSLDGDRLRVPEDGRTRVFESRDGGRSFHGLEADRTTTLMRRDIPAEDISRHCADPRHAVITLTEPGAAHLATVCDGVEWILPLEIQDRLPLRTTGEIAFAGLIDYDRKALHSLLQGCEALRENEFIRIIGGSRKADIDDDRFVKQFKKQVTERGLDSKLRFTGYLPYGEFVETIRSCRFLLPLVDDYVDSGSYLIKLTAAVPSSLGLGVPLIINQSIADRFDLRYMVCYPDDDLASGLKAEQRLSERGYAAMLASLDRHAEALYRRNIKVLAGLIERITGRNPGGSAK
jgi:glycosyltransferase involved in cell wall biosynthesis